MDSGKNIIAVLHSSEPGDDNSFPNDNPYQSNPLMSPSVQFWAG